MSMITSGHRVIKNTGGTINLCRGSSREETATTTRALVEIPRDHWAGFLVPSAASPTGTDIVTDDVILKAWWEEFEEATRGGRDLSAVAREMAATVDDPDIQATEVHVHLCMHVCMYVCMLVVCG